jgi:hypothetical protein
MVGFFLFLKKILWYNGSNKLFGGKEMAKRSNGGVTKTPLLISLLVWTLRGGIIFMSLMFLAFGLAGSSGLWIVAGEILTVVAAIAAWLFTNALAKMRRWTLYVGMALFAFFQVQLIMTLIYERHDYASYAFLWWYALGSACFIGMIVYLWKLRSKFN